jgi:iron complex outermembrane receptor protein
MELKRSLALAGAFAACGVAAQTQQPPAQKVERIEVTGSSIKRIEGETALPVTIFTREDIQRSGATTPMELLQLVSANASTGNVSLANVIGTTTFSNQTASLRGLGGGRTLILVNGRRVDGFAGEVQGVQGVNLSVIPFSAIERVEVLKDGASAIYGSDAIGGVINFIIRQDFRGAEASVYYGRPTRSGGGQQERVSAALGFGDLGRERYNVFLAGSWDNQKNLQQKDRNFSNTSYRGELGLYSLSSNTFPGNITTGGIGVPGFPAHCAPSTFFPEDPFAFGPGGSCQYDPSAQPGVEMIPDDRKANFFGSARFQLTPDVQAYVTALASRDVTRYVIQPVPISSIIKYGTNADIPSTITIRPSSPFYPHDLARAAGVDGQPLDVRYRAIVNGLRDTTDTNEGSQVVVGLKGTSGRWDWDGAYFYSEGRTRDHLNDGFPVYTQLLPLLNSGRVNLFGPNTPQVEQEIRATNFVGDTLKGKSKNSGIGAKASSDLVQLRAGPLAIAFGAEARKETLDQTYDPLLKTGTLSGFGGSFPDLSADRTIRALFFEAVVPVFRGLEANLAVRNDHYSDFGSTTNPKASLRWEANKSLLLRTSYGKGFLAPSLYQLDIPQSAGLTVAGTSDPIRCPVTHNTGVDCFTQFGIIFGGNPALQPEKSEQATFGFVMEAGGGITLSADYFKTRLNQSITNGVPYTTILNDLAQFGSLVTRGPVDPAFPNLPGPIVSFDQRYLNLGALHIEGFDVEGHWKGPQMGWGRLRIDITGTYYRRNDAQNLDGSYTGFVSNQFGAVTSGVLPRWKHYASLSWDRGPWSATLGNQFQSSYVDVNTDFTADALPRRVSSLTLWDLQGVYRGFRNLTLTLGVKNVLDTNPPASNSTTTFQVGFDPSYYDSRARFVYGSMSYAF